MPKKCNIMKRFLLTFFLLTGVMLLSNAYDGPLGTNHEHPVGFQSHSSHPALAQPVGTYNDVTHELSICFPAIGFSNYTIEVSSAYASLEYYVYTPTVQINLSQMLYDQVDLTIYTESGDIYYATVDTTDAQQQTE